MSRRYCDKGQLSSIKRYEAQFTSGYPLGSKNSSGTTPLSLLLGVELGGEGFAVYSVKLKLWILGVLGRLPFGDSILCPLTPVLSIAVGAIVSTEPM